MSEKGELKAMGVGYADAEFQKMLQEKVKEGVSAIAH